MKIVDAVVKRTNADVSDSAKVLQDILAAAANERGEWELPLSQEKTAAMRQALEERSDHLNEVRGHLGFTKRLLGTGTYTRPGLHSMCKHSVSSCLNEGWKAVSCSSSRHTQPYEYAVRFGISVASC